MKEERNRVYIRSCKMVLWPIRARYLNYKLFYKEDLCSVFALQIYSQSQGL